MASVDLYSNVKPVLGTNAGVALNGVAALTPGIDTKGAKAVVGLLVATTAIAWTDMTMNADHSDDGVTWALAPADSVLFRRLTGTSRVFHAGYIGKKRYVRFRAQTTLGTELGQLTVMLGDLEQQPFDYVTVDGQGA